MYTKKVRRFNVSFHFIHTRTYVRIVVGEVGTTIQIVSDYIQSTEETIPKLGDGSDCIGQTKRQTQSDKKIARDKTNDSAVDLEESLDDKTLCYDGGACSGAISSKAKSVANDDQTLRYDVEPIANDDQTLCYDAESTLQYDVDEEKIESGKQDHRGKIDATSDDKTLAYDDEIRGSSSAAISKESLVNGKRNEDKTLCYDVESTLQYDVEDGAAVSKEDPENEDRTLCYDVESTLQYNADDGNDKQPKDRNPDEDDKTTDGSDEDDNGSKSAKISTKTATTAVLHPQKIEKGDLRSDGHDNLDDDDDGENESPLLAPAETKESIPALHIDPPSANRSTGTRNEDPHAAIHSDEETRPDTEGATLVCPGEGWGYGSSSLGYPNTNSKNTAQRRPTIPPEETCPIEEVSDDGEDELRSSKNAEPVDMAKKTMGDESSSAKVSQTEAGSQDEPTQVLSTIGSACANARDIGSADEGPTLTMDDNGPTLPIDDGQSTLAMDDNGPTLHIDDGQSTLAMDDNGPTLHIDDGQSTLAMDDNGPTLPIDDGQSTLAMDDGSDKAAKCPPTLPISAPGAAKTRRDFKNKVMVETEIAADLSRATKESKYDESEKKPSRRAAVKGEQKGGSIVRKGDAESQDSVNVNNVLTAATPAAAGNKRAGKRVDAETARNAKRGVASSEAQHGLETASAGTGRRGDDAATTSAAEPGATEAGNKGGVGRGRALKRGREDAAHGAVESVSTPETSKAPVPKGRARLPPAAHPCSVEVKLETDSNIKLSVGAKEDEACSSGAAQVPAKRPRKAKPEPAAASAHAVKEEPAKEAPPAEPAAHVASPATGRARGKEGARVKDEATDPTSTLCSGEAPREAPGSAGRLRGRGGGSPSKGGGAPRVLFTGLENKQMEGYVTRLGGEVVTSPSECTHLVADKVRWPPLFRTRLVACWPPLPQGRSRHTCALRCGMIRRFVLDVARSATWFTGVIPTVTRVCC